MKKISLLCVLVFLFINTCYAQVSEKEDITFIKAFYKAYITEVSKEDLRTVDEKPILKKFCTKRLFDFVEKEVRENELDWDPFLNAQDTDYGTIATLKVQKLKSKYSLYAVSYIWPPTKELVNNIRLIVIRENGKPKIDYVYINSHPDKKYKDVALPAE